MKFIFFIHDRKDYSKNIVWSISFHDKLNIGNPVYKDGSRDKYLFEGVESITIGEIKLLGNVLPSKMYQ